MNELASEVGSAVCRSLEALNAAGLAPCGDPGGVTVFGYLLLLLGGIALAVLFVSDRLSVSDFVRAAIEERVARRSLAPSRDRPG